VAGLSRRQSRSSASICCKARSCSNDCPGPWPASVRAIALQRFQGVASLLPPRGRRAPGHGRSRGHGWRPPVGVGLCNDRHGQCSNQSRPAGRGWPAGKQKAGGAGLPALLELFQFPQQGWRAQSGAARAPEPTSWGAPDELGGGDGQTDELATAPQTKQGLALEGFGEEEKLGAPPGLDWRAWGFDHALGQWPMPQGTAWAVFSSPSQGRGAAVRGRCSSPAAATLSLQGVRTRSRSGERFDSG